MWEIPAATAYGGILLTRGGRILLREPANHYDGYVWTYAKGRPDPGETPEQAALREVREELGYEAEVVDVLPGVFKGGTTTNAFFVMRHIGPPGQPEWETASVRWVDFAAAERLIARTTNAIGRSRDLAILAAVQSWFEANQTVGLPDDEYPTFPARSYDWEISPMPARQVVLALDFTLTAAEAARIRQGFIPQDQDDRWFAYYEGNVLYTHRSWTGYCIYQIHFVPDGEGLRATHAEVNREPEQYQGQSDEDDAVQLEARVRELARLQDEPEAPSSLMRAIERASQPNYLGNPETVSNLLEQFFDAHLPGANGLPSGEARQAARASLARIMCQDDTGYARMPSWHTETALGQNLITAFGLDRDYCAGENLFFIVSEALAGLGMAVDSVTKALLTALSESEDSAVHERLRATRQALFEFAVQTFLGTQMALSPGKTLGDFRC